ncbi:hypothetical protein [Schlesneria sp. T3-172]|uniref:hypothetical protein n=1 Tax=Schlesneria sphaerica TaxID=3373610 RepID=UPI0037C802CF
MSTHQWMLLGVTVAIGAIWTQGQTNAQQIYVGSTPAEMQYPRSMGLDSNGRAVGVEGRSVDQYGTYTDDYGRQTMAGPATFTAVPGHYHGGGYTSGGYYPGGFSGLGYSNSIGYSVGLSGYSGGYYSAGYGGPGPVVATNTLLAPRTIVVGGVYPSRTVLNNATRGGVIEYTHGGNGYVYTPGSSYQTVISSGPSIFPATTIIESSQPPVIIEQKSNKFLNNSKVTAARGTGGTAEIKLIFPKEATGALSYVLNGTTYTIKPGYHQTFVDDRVWTIEFLRGGNRSLPMRYQLTAGTYIFEADENGWDLKQVPQVIQAVNQTVPAPPPPAPVPTPGL